MTEDRGQSGDGADPEERAFTGNADMPPEAPDQPASDNKELLRPDDKAAPVQGGAEKSPNPHGEYTNLPGYGG